jgi:hypothetical protein
MQGVWYSMVLVYFSLLATITVVTGVVALFTEDI